MDKTTLREIKRIKSDIDFSIPVKSCDSIIGKLKPITYYDIGNDEIIENLMIWRNQNITAYMSHEKATFEGTRRWLCKFILDNDSKILFLLYSDGNKPIGHMGLANGLDLGAIIEMDNIVRGVALGHKGLITIGLYDLVSWVFSSFACNTVYLRVFSNNSRALKLYHRLKFVEKNKQALHESSENDVTKYSIVEEGEASGIYFSYMELQKNDHYENYKNIKGNR